MLVWRRYSSSNRTAFWEGALATFGLDRVVFSQPVTSGRVRIEIFDVTQSEAEDLLKTFRGDVRDLRKSTADWVCSSLPNKPISIRGKLQIWNRPHLAASSDRTIYIPAALAFGTGDHATTATCLRCLCDVAGGFKRWHQLDAGTGTGILAIAGVKLGAARVDAFDADPIAVRTAVENAKQNGCAGQITFRKMDVCKYQPNRSYEIVTANLYSELFQRAGTRLWSAVREGGFLIVSGITRSDRFVLEEFAARIAQTSLIVRSRGRWLTAYAQKTRAPSEFRALGGCR